MPTPSLFNPIIRRLTSGALEAHAIPQLLNPPTTSNPTATAANMGSLLKEEASNDFGDDVYVKIIDKLREYGVADLVSLPQLVVVGDQSSGKSSVLESLTGFAFPRAPGLCTRYATQITCKRDVLEGIEISIIPRPGSSEERERRLRGFKRSVELDNLALTEVFAMANKAMGIRKAQVEDEDEGEEVDGDADDGQDEDDDGDELSAFTEDILKIEISGPSQQHLTVIDVPGIFRAPTPGVTTQDDIEMVRNMVKRYMAESRTIILAVIPCNVDIATQEVLQLAEAVDPDGLRTMGVLTKPDLATEKATKLVVCDLVQGKRNDLRLGYCVVKNRSSDDETSSLLERHRSEKTFFAAMPWAALRSTGRVGIEALRIRLQELLRDITKKELNSVMAEVDKMLRANQRELAKLGPPRNDSNTQRRYLGQLSSEFQDTTRRAREAQYNGMDIFSERSDLRLVTRIIQLNDVFSETCWRKGHTRYFEGSGKTSSQQRNALGFDIAADEFPELRDILKEVDYRCPEPSSDSLMKHIEVAFNSSRGPELGTFGGSVLAEIFKEQSKKWEPLILQHTSQAIVVVHRYIKELLEEICSDVQVRDELWNTVLLKELRKAYQRAMVHARFLLDIERQGPPFTLNHYFNSNLQNARADRLKTSLTNSAGQDFIPSHQQQESWLQGLLSKLAVNKSNVEQVREDIHDILKSYYKVARKRFVDVICQQVVFYFLLDGKDSPLKIFCPDLVMGMGEAQLSMIAAEDSATRNKREQLCREIESLENAAALRFGAD